MVVLSPNLNIMIRAAEKAGKSLLRDFGEVEQLQVSRKGPSDFVSAADRRAEEIIFTELQKARPGYSFLMEEGGAVAGENKDYRWIVDPLDGTLNFLHGVPHWAISIGLEEKGEITAGIVYDPVKDEMFRAEKNGGAFLRRKRLRVSGRTQMEMATIASGGPRRDGKSHEQFFKEQRAVWDAGPSLRRYGAAALDMCYVAAGRFEAYWERALKPWDVAAGYLIVKEAGGFVCDLDSDAKNAVETGNVLCGNEIVYGQLKKILRA
ncbi:MAG: inositol monophosphatase family protein [Alphaproteobacteria bacterium]